jgi:hypothetical protein
MARAPHASVKGETMKKRQNAKRIAIEFFLIGSIVLAAFSLFSCNPDSGFQPQISVQVGSQTIASGTSHNLSPVASGVVGDEETFTIGHL